MKKRILTFGYTLNNLQGFSDLSYSNYKFNFYSDEIVWQKRINHLKDSIKNDKFRCVIFIVTETFLNHLNGIGFNNFIGVERLNQLIIICKEINCIVAIQEHLNDSKPLYFDYISNKKYNLLEFENYINSEFNNLILNNTSPESVIEDLKSYSRTLPNESIEDKYISRYIRLYQFTSFFNDYKQLIKIFHLNFKDIQIFRYKKDIEKSIQIELSEKLSNELFNIYVSKKYVFKNEMDDFVKLFEYYLKQIENLKFDVQINETNIGVHYKFILREGSNAKWNIEERISEFSKFINLCQINIEEAIKKIKNSSVKKDLIQIIERLLKKYKRLAIDIQQQKELLELKFKQELQIELLESNYPDSQIEILTNNISSSKIEYNDENSDSIENQIKRLIEVNSEKSEIANINSDFSVLNDSEISQTDREISYNKIKKRIMTIRKDEVNESKVQILDEYLKFINTKLH